MNWQPCYHLDSPFARGILPKGYDAITLWRHIYVKRRWIPPTLARHEEKHVEQWKRYGFGGLGFIVRYAWFQLVYGYADNPLEVEARRAELHWDGDSSLPA